MILLEDGMVLLIYGLYQAFLQFLVKINIEFIAL